MACRCCGGLTRRALLRGAAVAFSRRMLALERGDRVPAFLSTHPAGQRRIEELERLLTSVPG